VLLRRQDELLPPKNDVSSNYRVLVELEMANQEKGSGRENLVLVTVVMMGEELMIRERESPPLNLVLAKVVMMGMENGFLCSLSAGSIYTSGGSSHVHHHGCHPLCVSLLPFHEHLLLQQVRQLCCGADARQYGKIPSQVRKAR
jgi:hypothetical protein